MFSSFKISPNTFSLNMITISPMTWFKDYNWEGYVERPTGDNFEKAGGIGLYGCFIHVVKMMSLCESRSMYLHFICMQSNK